MTSTTLPPRKQVAAMVLRQVDSHQCHGHDEGLAEVRATSRNYFARRAFLGGPPRPAPSHAARWGSLILLGSESYRSDFSNFLTNSGRGTPRIPQIWRNSSRSRRRAPVS